MAELHVFPLHRRRDFVRGAAASVLRMTGKAGEAHIRRLLKQQCTSMERRGFTPSTINAELQRLEAAIRVELWRVVMGQGGAA